MRPRPSGSRKKTKARQRGAPVPPKVTRRQLEFLIKQKDQEIQQARTRAAAYKKKLAYQRQVNKMLQQWHCKYARELQNSPRLRIVPAHIKSALANLDYHNAELLVLERQIERLALEHELATELSTFTVQQQIEREMAQVVRTHAQALQDAELVAKQLLNYEWPPASKAKKKKKKKQ
ncbi:hypothetical protein KKE06_02795 [Candidatus Micrarchaeota archaeon]|nr:hypothetical protein [Candidatus Micrarchaeota archaeon]MBU1930121.1 hypothetical protein [Candidatus Micrarchaeota archaeon]